MSAYNCAACAADLAALDAAPAGLVVMLSCAKHGGAPSLSVSIRLKPQPDRSIIAAIRPFHGFNADEAFCICGSRMPCDAWRLLGYIDALEQR